MQGCHRWVVEWVRVVGCRGSVVWVWVGWIGVVGLGVEGWVW